MKLGTYLKTHGISVKDFADAIDVSRMAVYQWLNGKRRPRPDIAKRISALTSGSVTIADLY